MSIKENEERKSIKFGKLLSDRGNGGRNCVIAEHPRNTLFIRYTGRILVFDLKTFENIGEINDVGSYEHQIRRFSKDIFVSVGYSVFFLSLDPPYKILKTIKTPDQVYDAFPLDDNDSLILHAGRCIHHLSYSKGKIIKTFGDNKSSTWLKRICRSKSNPENFFIYSDGSNPYIKILSSKTYKFVKEYEFRKKSSLYTSGTISSDFLFQKSYINKKGQEILILAGKGKSIIFFNIQEEKVIHEIPTTEWIFSLELIRNKYLLVGNQHGSICLHEIHEPIYEFHEEENVNIEESFYTTQKIKSSEVTGRGQTGWVLDMKVISIKNGKVTFVVIGEYGICFTCTIDGLKFPDNLRKKEWNEDTQERIIFFSRNINDYIFSRNEVRRNFIDLKLLPNNKSIEKISKVLLLY